MTRYQLALGILALDLAGALALAPRMPARVPVHWGIHGADRFGSPWELILLGPFVLALFLALLVYIRRIDPLASRPLEPGAPPAEQGALPALLISLMALGLIAHLALLAQLAGLVDLSPRLGALFGPALLVVLGNFLPRVRPNYFSGVRTPWTLASETVWRRTHRLAGKLLFFGGLASALFAAVSFAAATIAFLAVLLASSATSIIASYLWWRQEKSAAHS
jgi:uncharacterized membrane protein